MRVPLAEGTLAPLRDSTERDEALGNERPVLERCGENAVLVGEDYSRCKLGGFLGCLFADNSVHELLAWGPCHRMEHMAPTRKSRRRCPEHRHLVLSNP